MKTFLKKAGVFHYLQLRKVPFYGNILTVINMKKGYLVAIDLDGTLLSGISSHSEKCFNYIKEIAKFNYIVIATGRPWRGSRYFYQKLGLNTPIINYNGALVHNPTDSTFPRVFITIKKEEAIKILNDNIDIMENVFCEVDDEVYVYKEPNDDVENYLHQESSHLIIGNFKDTLNKDPNGVISFSPLGTEERLRKYMEDEFHGSLKIRFWHHDHYVISEIYNPETTKGNALKKIIDYYQVPFEKTISIGDGNNDIEMFKVTNIKVAMGNSHPTLLDHANFITKNVDDDGVYHFLFDFFNEKEL